VFLFGLVEADDEVTMEGDAGKIGEMSPLGNSRDIFPGRSILQ